jgi:hypothetical protein
MVVSIISGRLLPGVIPALMGTKIPAMGLPVNEPVLQTGIADAGSLTGWI